MITKYLISRHDKAGMIFLVVVGFMAVYVPLANLLLPETSPFHVPNHMVPLIGKYLCYAILAVALDLVWGYCGILSLGHCAFFAIGGYAMGMYLMRQIGTRGSYGHPILPDFMVFQNWTELPWFWHGFDMLGYAVVMAVLAPGALAFVFGWLAFRSRVTGVYLSIMTQALTYALMLAFFRAELGVGGNNGLTDFRDIAGFNIQTQETRAALFFLSAVLLIATYLVSRWMVTTSFGKVLVSVRDAEARARFLGYRTEHYKLFIFTVSAMMAGLAGALYVPQVGIINPSEFAPANSIEAVIWVAVGGRGTLVGAALGAFVVNFMKTYLTTGMFAAYWLFFLGGLFILVTLAMPKGILGTIHTLTGRMRRSGGARTDGSVNEDASAPSRASKPAE